MDEYKLRLKYIDALRGLAILAVIIFHYVPYLTTMYQINLGWSSELPYYGKYGVHLFFIVSGFVIYMTVVRAKTPLQFAFSRFSRLYPAFWLSVTLSSLLIIAFGHPYKVDYSLDLHTYLLNMTMFQRFFLIPSINGVYWTLTFELMFYFYMGLIMLLGFHKKSFLYSLVWLLFSITVMIYVSATDTHLSESIKGLFLIEFNSYFLTGVAMYNYQKNKNIVQLIVILALSLLQQQLVGGIELSMVFIITSSLFYLFQFINTVIINGLSSIGRISYSLYLIHSILGYVLMNELNELGFSVIQNTVITLSVVFVSSWVIFKFIEQPSQIRLRNWFKGVSTKKSGCTHVWS